MNSDYIHIERPNIKKKPRVLVCSGGGMKGFFLPSALYVAKQFGYLDKIDTLAGTSIGGLVLALYNLGYSPEELIKLFMQTDFEEMTSEMRVTNLSSQGWLMDGEWFESYFSMCIKEKTGKSDITLEELYQRSGITLILNTVLMSGEDGYHWIYDWKKEPKLSLITALRRTTNYPGLVKPTSATINDHEFLCYDGGAVDNYLVTLFHPDEILGFHLGLRTIKKKERGKKATSFIKDMRMTELFTMVKGALLFLDVLSGIQNIAAKEAEQQRIKSWLKDHNRKGFREIVIDVGDVKTFSVFAQPQQKHAMMMDGMRDALKFFTEDIRQSSD